MKTVLVAVMLVLAGCGTVSTDGQTASHDYRLFVEKMGSTGVSVVTTSRPAPVSLPGGFLAADGSRLFSSGGQVFGGSAGSTGVTVLNAYDTRSGAIARQLRLAGAWSWDGGGTSPDGRWVVLTGSRGFLVVDTTLGQQLPVNLDGRFSFDALSNDGQQLFLIETLAGSGYQVRLYDMFAKALRPEAVAIKGPGVEAMSGFKITAVADPDGHMLYSLYGRDDGNPPFVHALDLQNAVSYCIDLPALPAMSLSYLNADAAGWALSLDWSHRTLYASSPRGEVVAIDTDQNAVTRSAALAAPAPAGLLPPFIVNAAAKEFDGTPAASALDPTGRWLYVAWDTGFLPVDTRNLRPAALRDSGDHLSSLAVSPDGRHLFGVSLPNALADLDPQTGRRKATIGGLTAPLRILRLEPAA
ncbi:MAG TPA: hypothetical protein VIP52_00825 [Candidatus Dormibacteraeota bacterium]|jgi:hypothetical protein